MMAMNRDQFTIRPYCLDHEASVVVLWSICDFYKALDFTVDDVVSLGKRLESDRS